MITPSRASWHVILFGAVIAVSSALDASETRQQAAPKNGDAIPRLPGKFIRAELVTDDLAAARAFYGSMFGWKFRGDSGRLLVSNGGRPVADMVRHQRPAGQAKGTPRWFGYLSVIDVERARQAVIKAGGRVLAAPHEAPSRGLQAVFADREGALFGVIRSNVGDPADTAAAPGDWIWLQLLSKDAHRAADFYQMVGGYQINRNTAGNRSSDFILSSEGVARATVRTIPPGKSGVKPTWLPFVRVLHLEKSVAQAGKLGGKILVSARPDLMNGKVAVIADPTGAAVGLLEWNP